MGRVGKSREKMGRVGSAWLLPEDEEAKWSEKEVQEERDRRAETQVGARV